MGVTYACVEVRGQSENVVLSFHAAGSGDQTQVFKLGVRHLDLLNYLGGPRENINISSPY